MKTEVERFLREQNMLSCSGMVAGLSGGADSVCLLLILSELSKQHGFPLCAVHVHHGIRGEGADRDEAFAKALCERLGVPFFGYRVDVPEEAKRLGIGEEEAGRLARYRLFRETAEKTGASVIAIAHHRDDNAETVLFRLCRGTGIRGLCGIPAVSRPYETDGLTLIRPLLSFGREDILAELAGRGEAYCTDETNGENRYARNYIRNRIFPLLTEVNAGAVEHLAAFTEQAGKLMDFLGAEADKAYREAVVNGTVLRERLAPYPEIVRREALLRFVKELAGAEKDFTEQHAAATEQLLFGPVSKRLSLPYRLQLENTYEGIRRVPETVTAAEETELVPGEYPLGDGRTLSVRVRDYVPGEPIAKNKWIKWLDCDMIGCTPVLRTRREGDFFIVGKNGGTKLLREFYVSTKVPRAERDRIRFVAAGQEVLWIPGVRGTERYYVTGDTKRILILEVR